MCYVKTWLASHKKRTPESHQEIYVTAECNSNTLELQKSQEAIELLWYRQKAFFTRVSTILLRLFFLFIIVRVLFLWGLSPQTPALPHGPRRMPPQSSATEVRVTVLIRWWIFFTFIRVFIRHHKLILGSVQEEEIGQDGVLSVCFVKAQLEVITSFRVPVKKLQWIQWNIK